MIIDGYEITEYTNLSEEVCMKVLETAEREFGEIGNFLIEDNAVSFEVQKGYFEEAEEIILSQDKTMRLDLIDKFDDPFCVVAYEIHSFQERRPAGQL